MRTLTIIVSLLFSLTVQAQKGSPIFKMNAKGLIKTNPTMIDPFYDMPEIKNWPYVLNNSTSVSVGSRNFDVKTGYFEEMDETERGKYGFTVITIYSDSRKIFELRQPELWTYTYDGKSTMDYREYTDNRYFIPIPLSDRAVALAFIGWPYDSTPCYLTIIVVTNNDAKLVFNKNLNINTVTQSDDSYSMELQANVIEYSEDGKPFDDPNNVPIIHYLEAKNGMLYFK